MESLVFLIYSNTVVTILVALCIAFGIALLLQRFAKVSNQEAFLKDIQDQSILNGLDSKISFKPKSDDLCEAAWHYNEVKAKRLELIKK